MYDKGENLVDISDTTYRLQLDRKDENSNLEV